MKGKEEEERVWNSVMRKKNYDLMKFEYPKSNGVGMLQLDSIVIVQTT